MIHKCDQCGESFTENRSLTRHIQSKHADVKYSCDKCNYQATRKDNLNRHIKSKHAKSLEKFIELNKDDPTVAADLMETPRDFNDVNGLMIRKLNSDLFIILKL